LDAHHRRGRHVEHRRRSHARAHDRDDQTGKPPVDGFYAAEVPTTAAGNLLILAKTTLHRHPISATAIVPVRGQPPAAIGTPAISEPTPVATTPQEAAPIDTRDPPPRDSTPRWVTVGQPS
jgi:hypothetical protein